ncbi:MAG TPA: ATP-binding protein [Stellaceae bacterium]|nr:ATP-binding protein [Stellaceae bacterium]
MNGRARIAAFLRSREASGFVAALVAALLVSILSGYGYYSAGLRAFESNKSDEVITSLQLVDAFVSNYSKLRTQLGAGEAPVPATFRAHSIALFNDSRSNHDVLRLRWIGRVDRAIATPPADPAMADTIESFAGAASPAPKSQFVTVAGQTVFRTIYPSYAHEQSCVDCHNQLQPTQHWRLDDLMGAFSIDVPAGAFLHDLLTTSVAIAALLFFVIAGIALWVSLVQYRRFVEVEAAQRRIEESERRFRDFAEASSDWFWEQDAALAISFVSQNPLTKRLGATPADEIGKPWLEFVARGSTEAELQAHAADLVARRPFSHFRLQRIDDAGETRHVELSGKPFFDETGGFLGYRGTATDVTAEIAYEIELARRVEERTAELKRVQDELLRKERLSTLGQLTATIAHELRNPLSAIRNTAFTIAESAAAQGLRLERPVTRLERSIGRCDRLITDLLEYTRLREPVRMPLPLDSWLASVLDEQTLPEGTVLRRDFHAPDILADVDPELLRRVVVKLSENAVQALDEVPEGGRTLTVGTSADGSTISIVIEDSGPGIAPDVMGKIFDPLFSTRSFGTGLGLPTVKQIVEQHGGSVEIVSELGRGTRVVVTLAQAPAPIAEELAA